MSGATHMQEICGDVYVCFENSGRAEGRYTVHHVENCELNTYSPGRIVVSIRRGNMRN